MAGATSARADFSPSLLSVGRAKMIKQEIDALVRINLAEA